MSSAADTTYDQIEFTWKIENFDLYPYVHGSVIRSPLIALGEPSHSALYVELFHYEKSSERVLAYRIKSINKFPVYLGIKSEICIVDQDGATEVVPRLGLPLQEEKMMSQGTLTLQCLIWFNKAFNPDGISELSHTIGSLYNNEDFSDVKLLTNDKEFFLHKFLIHKRAPKLFDELGLRQETIENQSVKVENISTPALQNLLQYLYSGKLNPVSEESVPETYEMFEKYQLKEFKNEINSVSPATFCTRIKVVCKTIHLNIDVSKVLKERNVLTTCIHIDFARFLIKFRWAKENQGTRIHTSIQCVSSQEEEIVMSCNAALGLYVNCFKDENAERIRFSKWNRGKVHHLKKLFYSRKTSSMYGLHLRHSFHLNLHFKISKGENSSSVEVMTLMFPENPSVIGMHVLQDDLTELLNGLYYRKDGGDVCLDSGRGRGKVMVHKAVLAAWSPIFSSMFRHNMSEGKNDHIDISDIDSRTVFNLLHFMYTGQLYTGLADVQLYIVAYNYQVTPLFKKCSSSLESQLEDSNVCDIWVLAVHFNDEGLLAAVKNYIASRPASNSNLFYTEELDKKSADVQLYVVAHNYQATSLFRKCSSSLASKLADDNVCDIMVLANHYNDENLIIAAQHYIASRPHAACRWDFLYAEKFPSGLADVQLYMVAYSYQVTSLFKKCSSSLASQLADNNVCNILVLADQFNDESLLTAVQQYIASRRLVILGSTKWYSLLDSNPHLVLKVLRDMQFLAPSETL